MNALQRVAEELEQGVESVRNPDACQHNPNPVPKTRVRTFALQPYLIYKSSVWLVFSIIAT